MTPDTVSGRPAGEMEMRIGSALQKPSGQFKKNDTTQNKENL